MWAALLVLVPGVLDKAHKPSACHDSEQNDGDKPLAFTEHGRCRAGANAGQAPANAEQNGTGDQCPHKGFMRKTEWLTGGKTAPLPAFRREIEQAAHYDRRRDDPQQM